MSHAQTHTQNILIPAPHGRTTKYLTMQLITENPNSQHHPLDENTETDTFRHISCSYLYLLTHSRERTLSTLQSLFTQQYLDISRDHRAKESIVAFLNGNSDEIWLDEGYCVRVVWVEGDYLEKLREMYPERSTIEAQQEDADPPRKLVHFDSAVVCVTSHEYDFVKEIATLVVFGFIRRIVYVSTAFVERGYSLPAMFLNTIVEPLVVHYKLLSENALRKACRSVNCPYFIIRPVGLTNKAGLHKRLAVRKGDTFGMTKLISRQDVASVCVSCLYMHKFTTFSVAEARGERDKPADESTTEYVTREVLEPLEDDDFVERHTNHLGGRRLFVGTLGVVSASLVTFALMKIEPVRNASVHMWKGLIHRVRDLIGHTGLTWRT